jgi:6-pyruvoyltetrahydropterin/6-carboxytetrahydropterin synthase
MVELTRVYHFSAAHQLRNLSLSPEQNVALYGDCHRPHGHNYYLEVTVAGRPDPVTGMAVDLTRLDRAVSGAVLAEVDHHALEEVPALRGVITAGESLARAFWRILVPALPAGSLRRVTVVETAKNRFEYEGGERCSKS